MDAGGQPKWDVITKPLARREIKAIFDTLYNSCEQIRVDNELLPKMRVGINMAKRKEFENAVNASPAWGVLFPPISIARAVFAISLKTPSYDHTFE